MSDLMLFIIGCAVSFLFLGGMLIHMVAGQKIADAEDLDEDPGRRKEGAAGSGQRRTRRRDQRES